MAARGRARGRRGHRLPHLARREPGLLGRCDGLSRPAVHADRRRAGARTRRRTRRPSGRSSTTSPSTTRSRTSVTRARRSSRRGSRRRRLPPAPPRRAGRRPNPLVKVSVQAKKGKVAACAANGLADEVVKKLGTYPANKIKNLESHDRHRQRRTSRRIQDGDREPEHLRHGQADPPDDAAQPTSSTRRRTRSCSCWRRTSSRRRSSPMPPRTRSRRAAGATRSSSPR